MFENHLNTFPDPALIPMNARRANKAQNMIAGYGSPLLFVLLKILGAFPETARPSGLYQVSDCRTEEFVVYHLLTESSRAGVKIAGRG